MLWTNGEKGKILSMENKVRERRYARGIKQAELAKMVKVSQSALSDIESGKHTPGVDAAIRIARVLKCDVEDLFVEPEDGIRE